MGFYDTGCGLDSVMAVARDSMMAVALDSVMAVALDSVVAVAVSVAVATMAMAVLMAVLVVDTTLPFGRDIQQVTKSGH